MSGVAPFDPFVDVVGQPEAVRILRGALADPVHAYLFEGPSGSGRRSAAMAFAAELLAAGAPDPDRTRRLALSGQHADLVVVEREGASISVDAARDVITRAHRSPIEADRQVLVLVDFHLVRDAGPILLKTVEEPPASTVFVILADEVPGELVTIASRCVIVPFRPLSSSDLTAALIADGVDPDRAAALALGAGGDLRRARILARDPEVEARTERWRGVVDRLDGTGHTALEIVDELLAQTDAVAAPFEAAHRAELDELAQRLTAMDPDAVFAPGKSIVERHKRELRRARTDELRAGLRTLADRLRTELVHGHLSGPEGAELLGRIASAGAVLAQNPNERLLLQSLLGRIGRIRPHRGNESTVSSV